MDPVHGPWMGVRGLSAAAGAGLGAEGRVPGVPPWEGPKHAGQWAGSDTGKLQNSFSIPRHTDMKGLLCKGSFHFPLTFQCFLLIFIT